MRLLLRFLYEYIDIISFYIFISIIMLGSVSFARIGYFDFTARTPPEYGGNKSSGTGYLISSFFMLISAFAFLLGIEWFDAGTFAIGSVFFVIATFLRSPHYNKPDQ